MRRCRKADVAKFGKGWILLKNSEIGAVEKTPKTAFEPGSSIKGRALTPGWPPRGSIAFRVDPRVLF